MPVVTEDMKAWSAALETEVADWPRVTSKPMFGLVAFYRGKHIFAILPRTRALGSASALAFKLEKGTPRILAATEREPRIQTTIMKARKWYLFEMSADSDLREALAWLRRAYEAAT
jgi:TfoX/Sxy family transcriptional regulator of competence genes